MQRLFTALCLLVFTALSSAGIAQNTPDTALLRVFHGRAAKIVTPLSLSAKKTEKVTDIVANQYLQLNTIQEERDAALKAAKASNTDKAAAEASAKAIKEQAETRTAKLHKAYLKKLNKQLDAKQVDAIKDGMTYNVLPNTYKAYQEMLPSLTEPQKAQILAWLTEAREHAMDAESSEKKHAWFGKYKGRINNYLSAAGVDMKKAGEEWQARIKAGKASK